MNRHASGVDAVERKILRLRGGASPRVVDLFSGCGGLSLGFERAGFAIVSGVENNPDAAASHAVNLLGASFPQSSDEKLQHVREITRLEPDELAAEIGFDDSPADAVDVLIGGPPCQSYARVGRAKLREISDHPSAFKVDPRANLYLRYLQYVHALQPLVILMENVPDILNFGGHNIAEEVAEALPSYECSYTLLNSVFYGVPQMRERMFLLAYHRRLKTNVNFPVPDHYFTLPAGYHESRKFALKHLLHEELIVDETHYKPPPEATSDFRVAVTAREALGDLPRITDHLSKRMTRGPRCLRQSVTYLGHRPSGFARQMRLWPGHGSLSQRVTTAHVIRLLPRDYKIFKRMRPGDQYPEAHALAHELFTRYINKTAGTRRATMSGSEAYERVKKEFVPPYDPNKFPNKWRKIEADKPARTVMAHLGKDSYSHIHYDSNQARTISVREAARLQSFPDGFVFIGRMNAAFRQIGNAVPPLLAWKIAQKIMDDALEPIQKYDRKSTDNES